jgi:hypothetical protein
MSKALKHRWLASYQEQTKQQDPPQQQQQQQQDQLQAKQPASAAQAAAAQVMLLLMPVLLVTCFCLSTAVVLVTSLHQGGHTNTGMHALLMLAGAVHTSSCCVTCC